MLPLKLTKNELEQFKDARAELYFNSLEECISQYEKIYDDITLPIKNPAFQNESKENFFHYRVNLEHYHLLCLGYDKALTSNDPSILLKSFYSYNHLDANFQYKDDRDHSAHLKSILLCYAGNNFNLIDDYLPKNIGLSRHGHRFSITAVNLILAIRDPQKKKEVEKQVEAYLSKKNTKFCVAIILALYAISTENPNEISKHLELITKCHKSSNWLHGCSNNIGKFLPFFSYGILSLAYHSLDMTKFELIGHFKNKIWWQSYIDFNCQHKFKQGDALIGFSGKLDFLKH